MEGKGFEPLHPRGRRPCWVSPRHHLGGGIGNAGMPLACLGHPPKFNGPYFRNLPAFRVPGPFIVPAVPWMFTLAGLILRVRAVRFRLLPPWPLLAPVGGCSGLRRAFQ